MKRIQQFPPCRRRLDIIHKANVALTSKIILIVACEYSCLSWPWPWRACSQATTRNDYYFRVTRSAVSRVRNSFFGIKDPGFSLFESRDPGFSLFVARIRN